jgi:translocator protein
MVIENATVWVCVFLVVSIFFPAFLRNFGDQKSYYEKYSASISFAPPSWLFGPMWFVLYVLISASEILHIMSVSITLVAVDAYYISIVALFMASVFFGHFWVKVFFQVHNAGFAVVVAFITFATALSVLIMYAMVGLWTSFALYFPYTIWLLLALFLNYNWLRTEEYAQKNMPKLRKAAKITRFTQH